MQGQSVEGVLGENLNAARGNLLTLPGRPDPVSQVANPVLLVYLVQASTAKKFSAILGEDTKLVRSLRFTTLSASCKPLQGIFVDIAIVAPWHPSTNSLNRLQNCPRENGRVAAFEWPK